MNLQDYVAKYKIKELFDGMSREDKKVMADLLQGKMITHIECTECGHYWRTYNYGQEPCPKCGDNEIEENNE